MQDLPELLAQASICEQQEFDLHAVQSSLTILAQAEVAVPPVPAFVPPELRLVPVVVASALAPPAPEVLVLLVAPPVILIDVPVPPKDDAPPTLVLPPAALLFGRLLEQPSVRVPARQIIKPRELRCIEFIAHCFQVLLRHSKRMCSTFVVAR